MTASVYEILETALGPARAERYHARALELSHTIQVAHDVATNSLERLLASESLNATSGSTIRIGEMATGLRLSAGRWAEAVDFTERRGPAST